MSKLENEIDTLKAILRDTVRASGQGSDLGKREKVIVARVVFRIKIGLLPHGTGGLIMSRI